MSLTLCRTSQQDPCPKRQGSFSFVQGGTVGFHFELRRRACLLALLVCFRTFRLCVDVGEFCAFRCRSALQELFERVHGRLLRCHDEGIYGGRHNAHGHGRLKIKTFNFRRRHRHRFHVESDVDVRRRFKFEPMMKYTLVLIATEI